MTDLSVIIVCYRGWDRLKRCLDSLKSLAGAAFTHEVIVVDNCSGDDTITQIENQYPGFRFIHNKINGGYANGNNLGSKFANGEFLLILNPDTFVTMSAFELLLATARSNPHYSVISCRQVNGEGKEVKATGEFPAFWNLTGFQRSVLKIFSIRNESDNGGSSVTFPDWVSGSVLLIKRELYYRMGGFFEEYWMYYEDVDLCKRVADSGGKIAFLNEVTIGHDHGGSSRINQITTSVTKAEVLISRHVYISMHFKGAGRILTHGFLVINNIVSGAIMAVIGITLFFVPKVFVRTMVFFRLLGYYPGALFRRSWISPRAVGSQNVTS